MHGAKKGILPYEEFPLRRGENPPHACVLRLRRQPPTAGSADPHVWPARCTGNWCKPPGASCASAETANPLSSAPLPRHPCSAGGLRPQAPQPTRPDPDRTIPLRECPLDTMRSTRMLPAPAASVSKSSGSSREGYASLSTKRMLRFPFIVIPPSSTIGSAVLSVHAAIYHFQSSAGGYTP